MKEEIKKDILETVKVIDTSLLEFTDVREYEHLVYDNIWTKAIQTALEEKQNVYIPYMGHEIITDNSIFMDSDTHLKVDENQIIRLKEKTDLYMLRNRNILPGNFAPATLTNPDENITVEGGIWKSPGNTKKTLEWCCCVTATFAFSNVRYVNVTNVHFDDMNNYALIFSNCENFYVDNILFTNCLRDGYHVDGPAKYGIARNLRGDNLGDDMVAILSWDWYNCGMSHGDIEKMYVENVHGKNNEFRLLTGEKIYPNGRYATCDLKDCVFENMSGFYVYKMYYQPHCRRVVNKDKDFDRAETVGKMDNIYFDNIEIEVKEDGGFGGIDVCGLFDILADCTNIHFENVRVSCEFDEFDATGMRFVNVGPLSSTWKYGNAPEDWGDLFDADRCCEVDDIYLKNITFNDVKITDGNALVKEKHQKINEDYPNTTPAGGTGFGKVNKVIVE